jgi:hypothetical protein
MIAVVTSIVVKSMAAQETGKPVAYLGNRVAGIDLPTLSFRPE